MKRSKGTKKGKSKAIQNNLSDEQFEAQQDQFSQDFVEAKREVQKKKASRGSKKAKKSTAKDGAESDGEIIDIKRGDEFIKQHYRPSFLSRWDGESNELEITEDEIAEMSPLMKVYWRKKSLNMNCVIFVMIGKNDFHCFEDDALKVGEIFNRRIRTFAGFLLCYFYYSQMDKVKKELFARNIPMLMLNEVNDPKYREQFGILRREFTEIITPGLYLNLEPNSYRQRIILTISKGQRSFGVVALESETNQFYAEEIPSDGFTEIRRIINRYRPVQIILDRKALYTRQIKQIAKGICHPYFIDIDQPEQGLKDTVENMLKVNGSFFFQNLQHNFQEQQPNKDTDFSMYQTVQALNLVLTYLTNFNLRNKIFGQGIFEFAHLQKAKIKPMFDSQVYENLEVFRLKNEDQGQGKPGTLLAYLDHCITNSGKKLLRRWIDEPLRDLQAIKERQKAIQELVKRNQSEQFCKKFHAKFVALERLEKDIAGVYHWVLQNSEQGKLKLTRNLKFNKDYNQNKNPAVVKLKQIYRILSVLQVAEKLFKELSESKFESILLNKITSIKEINYEALIGMATEQLYKLQGIPSIEDLANYIKSKFQYDEASGYLEPTEGVSEIYDMEKKAIQDVQEKLDEKLKEWKTRLGVNKISYASIHARNQIQMAKNSLQGKKFKELIFCCETANQQRYTTVATNELSEELVEHEQNLAKAYEPFLNQMVMEFGNYKYIWDLYVRNFAQLDVLLSMAKLAAQMPAKCTPQFVPKGVKVVQGLHLGLIQVMENVVPTTLVMRPEERVLLLTGPNMGGKSTLLRQTCLLAILAQIGSYVPAKQYQSIIFDQIFCRIGASDRISEGKSTFYVQLQETERIISHSTPQSLVIIDELGRGTSTYDGMSIADSCLRYLLEQTFSYSLFSTHYTPITNWFIKNPTVKCMKMGYIVKEDGQNIEFTYQLQPGIAQKSFANNVARMVGIHEGILQIANFRSREITEQDEIADQKNFKQLLKKVGMTGKTSRRRVQQGIEINM